MTPFWTLASLMVVIAVALVLVPMWWHRAQTDLSRDKVNAAIFRERLRELDNEQREGRLNADGYRQLRTELERTLLTDMDAQDAFETRRADQRSTLKIAVLVGLLLPLFGLSYYYLAAYRGEAEDWITVQRQLGDIADRILYAPDTLSEGDLPDDLPNLTRVLQSRALKQGMKDPDTLHLLGASYLQLQQIQLATTALARAYELAPAQPNIMFSYAEALLIANQGELNQTSAQLLKRLLQLNPDNERVLFLLGWGSFNAGSYKDAVNYWQSLLTLRDPASEGAQVLRNSIAEAQARQAELDRQAQASQQGDQEAGNRGPQIAVTVDLAPPLRSRLGADATLFVFAKAAGGPPMPLAAIRQPVRDFPVEVVLNDAQAMVPSMKLSQFKQVVVGARISQGGQVSAQSGDLQSLSDPLDLEGGRQSVALVIDQVVP